jgi:hypothetical protein
MQSKNVIRRYHQHLGSLSSRSIAKLPAHWLGVLIFVLSACGQQAIPIELGKNDIEQTGIAADLKGRNVNFGENVKIFDPSMPISQIQATVDAIATQQVDNEMGTQRYTLLFKPGVYGTDTNPLVFQVGYYTEVAGLGALPTDVTINGHVDVYNRCLTPDNCTALVNFWRSLSNLTINVKGLADCRSSGNFWAVSQAAPMRRVNITGGNLTLMDYCTAGPQFASGGFIADSKTGFIINGSQQQFLVRDSNIGGWSNGVWNQVFSGVAGAPAQSFSTTPYDPAPYTTLATSPISREKPFLYAVMLWEQLGAAGLRLVRPFQSTSFLLPNPQMTLKKSMMPWMKEKT